MNPVFKKLNFKDQSEILVLNAPESFGATLEEMTSFTSVKTQLEHTTQLLFALAFVTKQQEVDTLSKQFAEKLADDGLIWFAYPKGSSKRYKCEFNRDNGWEVLGKEGFEPVRMVAIDEDWSALRFRRTNFIKTMTRSRALSDEGKERLQKA
ncbi:MAG: hypothetical protein U0Y10_04385 [Spirosomataceae bacterium]